MPLTTLFLLSLFTLPILFWSYTTSSVFHLSPSSRTSFSSSDLLSFLSLASFISSFILHLSSFMSLLIQTFLHSSILASLHAYDVTCDAVVCALNFTLSGLAPPLVYFHSVRVCVYLPSCILQEKSYAHAVLSPYLQASSLSLNSWIFLTCTTVSPRLFHTSIWETVFLDVSSTRCIL